MASTIVLDMRSEAGAQCACDLLELSIGEYEASILEIAEDDPDDVKGIIKKKQDPNLQRLKYYLEQAEKHATQLAQLQRRAMRPKCTRFKDLVLCGVPSQLEIDISTSEVIIKPDDEVHLIHKVRSENGLWVDLNSKTDVENGIRWLSEQIGDLKGSPYHYQHTQSSRTKSFVLAEAELLRAAWENILKKLNAAEMEANGPGEEKHVEDYDPLPQFDGEGDDEYDPVVDNPLRPEHCLPRNFHGEGDDELGQAEAEAKRLSKISEDDRSAEKDAAAKDLGGRENGPAADLWPYDPTKPWLGVIPR